MEKRMDETMDAEKFLKELIHRALLGDEQAQQECTEKGIALPCPFCGGTGDNVALHNNPNSTQFWGYCWGCHTEGPIAHGSVKNALSIWNIRPAPPVGRCKDCLWYLPISKRCKYSLGGLWGEVNELSFCSCFNPKED